MADSINPIWSVLAGGGLTLAGSFAATWWAKRLERVHQERQLARAIKGELSAMIHISSSRGYTTQLRNAIQHMQATGQYVLIYATIEDSHSRIFRASLDKIGYLPGELPTEVSITYSQIASVITDFNDLSKLAMDPELPGERTSDALVRRYTAMIELADDAMERAAKIIAEIDRRYQTTD